MSCGHRSDTRQCKRKLDTRVSEFFWRPAVSDRGPKHVTRQIMEAGDGRREAVDELFRLVYSDLRPRAARFLRAEGPNQSLQTTALVHEAYLRLLKENRADWQDRGHFCAVAAMAMRRILVEHARARRRQKRGGELQRVALDSDVCKLEPEGRGVILLALDDALTRLAAIRPRSARVVELRYFGGLTSEEAAHALDVSTKTVTREWRYARAWLRKELESETSEAVGESQRHRLPHAKRR